VASRDEPAQQHASARGWDDITAMVLPDNDTAIVHLRAPYAAILGIFALGGAGYRRSPHTYWPVSPTSITRRSTSTRSQAGPTFSRVGITARRSSSTPIRSIGAVNRRSRT